MAAVPIFVVCPSRSSQIRSVTPNGRRRISLTKLRVAGILYGAHGRVQHRLMRRGAGYPRVIPGVRSQDASRDVAYREDGARSGAALVGQ